MASHVLVFAGDFHCGSTLGLMHPEGAELDDGQRVMPSPLQSFMWEKHDEFRGDIRHVLRGERGCTRHLFLMGDLVDGDHHRTHQIVTPDQGVHIQMAEDVLRDGLLKIKFNSIHIVRGTPAHVGPASGLEKAVGDRIANRLGNSRLPVVRDPKTDSFLWKRIYAEFGGLLFDVLHHGKTSALARMRKSHAANYAQDIWQTHVNENKRPPDFAIRAHKHQHIDSGPDHRGMTRLIQMPCWQDSSEWVASRSIESKPDIGGVVVVIRDGRAEVIPMLYEPDPDPQPIWSP